MIIRDSGSGHQARTGSAGCQAGGKTSAIRGRRPLKETGATYFEIGRSGPRTTALPRGGNCREGEDINCTKSGVIRETGEEFWSVKPWKS